MSSRVKKIMALVSENSLDREISMYDTDSEKSLSLLQSSTSSADPGYVEVDPNNITSMSYQEVANTVQENPPVMLHNGTMDVGMSVFCESDKDDDIRDPDYQLEESSEETSEDDLVQYNVRERNQKSHYKKITNKNKELKIAKPRKITQTENVIIPELPSETSNNRKNEIGFQGSENNELDNINNSSVLRNQKVLYIKITNKSTKPKITRPHKTTQRENVIIPEIPSETTNNRENEIGLKASESNELDNDNTVNRRERDSLIKEISVDKRSLKVANSVEKTKKHFCLFCKKLQSKFARHLENKHSDKPQVRLFLSLPKKSSERSIIIDNLRKEGDFLYNSDSSCNKGDIILVRRPQSNKDRNPDHYLPCGNCSGMYSKLSINIHYRMCVKDREKFRKDTLCASRIKSYVNVKANYLMKNKILPPMRNDQINTLVRREELIILFGNRLTQKYRSPHLFKMIRSRLRCVGKFFWLFKKQRPEVKIFESVFDPIYYEDSIKSINNMAGLNEEEGKYTSPSTAACICSYLKKICLYLVSEMIKKNDKIKLDRVRDFYQLMQDGFTYDIYKTVSENQMEIKRHKVVKLPCSDDINLLRDYLDKYIRHNFKLLNDKFTEYCWKELSSAVLVSLQLFNRRRAGEIERVKISDFKEYEAVNVDDDINPVSQIHENQNYVRFLIRGKKGRGVPVLVDKFKLKCLKIILKYREMANVPSTNPFLFEIPGKDDVQHLEANRLMYRFAHCCGAKNPETLKGTELRKHFATKCGTMDLQGVDIKDVADYMGHHERIHLEHYRMPNATRDILRMSRLLEKAQGIDNLSAQQNTDQDDSFDQNPEQDESLQRNYEENQSLPSHPGVQDKTMKLTSTPDEKGRISWSKEEKKLVEDKAKFYFENFESPTMKFCTSLAKEPVLKRRSVTTVKAYIMNEIKRRKIDALILTPRPKCKRGVKKFWTEQEKEKVFEIFQENLQSKKLPSLAVCRKVISEHKIFADRTPAMLKTCISNILKKK